MKLDDVWLCGEGFDSGRPSMKSKPTLLQVLVVVVVGENTGQGMVGNLVSNKRLESQVGQSCNQGATKVMDMTRRYPGQCAALEHQ